MNEDPTLNPLSPSLAASAQASSSPAALDMLSIKALTAAIKGQTDALLQIDARVATVLKMVAENQKPLGSMRVELATISERLRTLGMSSADLARAVGDDRRAVQALTAASPRRVEVDVEVHKAPEGIHRLVDAGWPFVVSYFWTIGSAVGLLLHSVWTWL